MRKVLKFIAVAILALVVGYLSASIAEGTNDPHDRQVQQIESRYR